MDDLPHALQLRPRLESLACMTISEPHPFAGGLPADLTGLRNLDVLYMPETDGKML